jgi:hypothetical protein
MVARKTRHHRGVIAIGSVAVQFMEILKKETDVIHHVGTLGMAGEKCSLPGAQVFVKIASQLFYFAAYAFELRGRNLRPGHVLQVG